MFSVLCRSLFRCNTKITGSTEGREKWHTSDSGPKSTRDLAHFDILTPPLQFEVVPEGSINLTI